MLRKIPCERAFGKVRVIHARDVFEDLGDGAIGQDRAVETVRLDDLGAEGLRERGERAAAIRVNACKYADGFVDVRL